MHILYIHQYFGTSAGSAGGRSYEFARRWVKKGHRVTMVTTVANLTEQDLAQATGRFFKRFSVQGIDVIATGIAYRSEMSFARRLLAFIYFLLISSVRVLFISKVDITYATSTPLTVGIPAMVLSCLKRVPFVFEVRDQWPEIPIQMGIIKNKIMIRVLLWLEKTIYHYADSIIACSPGMAEGARRVLGDEQKPIRIIPNSSDIDLFRPDIDGSSIRHKLGWDRKLVLLYAGAMGRANSLNFIIDAAEKLKENYNIHFVLIGDGSEKAALARRIKQDGLSNVEIADSLPRRQLPEVFAAVDVSMVIFANYPILEHNSANKFFDSLSAGKPTILNYSGWQRTILEENNAGYGCGQYDTNEFVEKVLLLNSHKERLDEMGRNARRVAEEKFCRDDLSRQALEVLSRVNV